MKKNNRKIKLLIVIVFICVGTASLALLFQPIQLYSNALQSLFQKEKTFTSKTQSQPMPIKDNTSAPQDIHQDIRQINNIKQDPINILALGRPGNGYSGANLTDTLIVIHIKPTEEKAILISLPRDLLVQVPNYNYLSKINSLYYRAGIEKLKEKIGQITGLKINYYLLVDIKVVKEVIDLIDGLNVYVPEDIYDNFYPGPNYTYQSFNLPAGWRYLDGETALKYIRTRYTSPNGDFDRMARQQQILYLLKQKVLSYNLLWDLSTYLKIYTSLKGHIETDLGILKLKSFWSLARQIDPNNVKTIVIDKKETELLKGGLVNLSGQQASVIYPVAGQGNYHEIQKYIQEAIE